MAVRDNKKTDFPVVPDGASRSIVGPTVGWCDATTSTSDENVSMSAWAGHYITIEAITADHYIAFSDDPAETIETGAASVNTLAVPRTIPAGQSIDVVVPKGSYYLIYRTVSGTGILRAVRS